MEERKEFKYTIGDKVYLQRKLVLGQVNQILDLIKGLEIPQNATIMDLVTVLGDKISYAVGILLIPADLDHLKHKNLHTVVEDIQFDISPEQTLEVIEDFFDCNPISLLLNRVNEIVEKMGEKLNQKKAETEQKNSVQSSQEETSPNVTT
jgi:hypothetical protein